MLSVESYCEKYSISRRHLFRKISNNEVLALKREGKTYIIEKDELQNLSDKAKNEIKSNIEEQLDKLIIRAANNLLKADNEDELSWGSKAEAIRQINKIAQMYEYQGIKLKSGYSIKSLYRKINNPKSVNRKTRSDKFKIKNEILNNGALDKMRMLAAIIYNKSAIDNFSQTAKLLHKYASQNPEFEELSKIPFQTLYRTLKHDLKLSGFKTVHQYLNHYNKFYSELPINQGAFTDDIGFMDYFIIDDRKADVFQVLVHNPRTGKDEAKQVTIWTCIEAKTMKVLSVMIKAESFNAEDLILLIAQAVQQYGMPKKAIMADNGLGRSERFVDFVDRLAIATKHNLTIKYSAAYTPTNKSTIELMHALWKREHDAYYNNYVSPNKRDDSRHAGLELTPAKADYYLQEYKQNFLNYLDTHYSNVVRTRVINGIKTEISINDYFEKCWSNHTKLEVSPMQLRYAMAIEKIVVMKMRGIKILGDMYQPNNAFPIAYLDKKARAFYNPNNLNEVDLYAIDDILDRPNNRIIYKNEFICTLYNQRMNPNKYADIERLRKEYKKQLKDLSKTITDMKEVLEQKNIDPTPLGLPPNQEEINKRKEVEEQIRLSIEETKLKILYENQEEEEQAKENEDEYVVYQQYDETLEDIDEKKFMEAFERAKNFKLKRPIK